MIAGRPVIDSARAHNALTATGAADNSPQEADESTSARIGSESPGGRHPYRHPPTPTLWIFEREFNALKAGSRLNTKTPVCRSGNLPDFMNMHVVRHQIHIHSNRPEWARREK
jgi:hypothetical protein